MNEDKKMGMNVISAKDHGEAFLTLETGRAVAFMMDDALLYGEMAKARKPADWAVTAPLSPKKPTDACCARTTRVQESGGCSPDQGTDLGRGRENIQQMVLNPIPPKGLNLNMPLSDDMKAAFKAPNDKAFE
jgi:glutamate/aspartate transport system substrate-binding protein